MKCSNCSESISKHLIGKENKALDESSLKNFSENSYELLKKVTRGQAVTQEILSNLISEVERPQSEKNKLLSLTPKKYKGYAIDLCDDKK